MFLKAHVSVLFLCCYLLSSYNATDTDDCSKSKSLWESLKYPYNDGKIELPAKLTETICSTSKCCNGDMQNEMVAVSRLTVKAIAVKHLETMTEWLTNSSTSINDYLLSDIDNSRRLLNQMFQNTYSSNYKANEAFFVDFFDRLKQYVEGKQDDLQGLLDRFLAEMAERIVGMMIIAKKDQDTVRCLAGGLMKMDPFQGADKSLRTAVMGAYPPARMFVNGLRAVNDVFMGLKTNKTMPSWECSAAYSRAFYCPLCAGSKAKPCQSVCRAAVGRCLGALNPKEVTRLGKAWIKVIGTLGTLSSKMLHPFNMVEVNKNMHVKISEAIMNVHNFFPTVRDKIWANCKSQMNRKRRSSDYSETFPSGQSNFVDSQGAPTNVNMPKLVKAFTAKLPEMNTHLKKFKAIICDDKQMVGTGAADQCWNGVSVSPQNSKDKKQNVGNRKTGIDPSVKKSIERLNEIFTVLNSLISGQNKDPKTFPIQFVAAPKRPSRGQEEGGVALMEGSGEKEIGVSKKPSKIEAVLPNEQIVEGSGGSGGSNNIASVTESTPNNKPGFPRLPIIEQPVVTVKPDEPVKKPVIPDDEDMTDNTSENVKNELSNGKLEGSGSGDPKPRLPELPSVVTTTTSPHMVVPTESQRGRVPLPMPNKPLEGSGGTGEDGTDDETNRGTVIQRFPGFSTEAPVPPTTTMAPPPPETSTVKASVLQELPGDVPQEIWLPRVMEYAADGSLIVASSGACSHTVVLTIVLLAALLGNLLPI